MNPAVRLPRAVPADSERLGAVHVQAWREAYADIMPAEILARLDPAERTAMWRGFLTRDGIVHLAERDGAIVGFGSCRAQPDASLLQSAEISAIYVLHVAQRQGVGRALMAAMALDLLAQGHTSASLWVLEANDPARRFYASLGGREVARREQERGGFRAVGIAYGWDDLNVLTLAPRADC
jgi:ribosomal protein S18 acetylase RimI-like enzyme